MTWVEALPTVGVMLALLWGIKESRKIDKRMDYRGILDKRVEWSEFLEPQAPDMRLCERDKRLGLFPTNVQWVHPVWRPENYPEQQ